MSDAETEKRPAFKPGDVVRLKSGDTMMTVEKVDGDAVTAVYWFMGDLRCQTINGAMLFNQTIRDEWDFAMMEQEVKLRAEQHAVAARYAGELAAEQHSVVKAARDRRHRWMGLFH